MGFCDSIISCLFWVVNFIFAVCGLVIVGVGALIYSRYGDFDKFLDSPVASPPIVLIILGCVIFVIAFFGCCGAFTKSSCMLTAYGVAVILIFVAQVAVAIVALVNGKTTSDVFIEPLREEFKLTQSNKASYDLFSNLQSTLKCCGVTGPNDYTTYPGGPIKSCCADTVSLCTVFTTTYKQGCAIVLADFIDDNATIAGGVGIGIAVLEVLGAVVGFLLSSYIKKGL